jgi:hypothetical protein
MSRAEELACTSIDDLKSSLACARRNHGGENMEALTAARALAEKAGAKTKVAVLDAEIRWVKRQSFRRDGAGAAAEPAIAPSLSSVPGAPYRIVRFEMIPTVKLYPHPAAEVIPMDKDDQAAIGGSVAEVGVLVPLLVMEAGDGGREVADGSADSRFLIVDGVNRWRQAAGNLERLPCLVVEGDAGTIVANCLLARRKAATAQRVLVYLECHKEAVLRSWDEAGGRYGNLKTGRFSRNAHVGVSESDFSGRRIAERLGVHHNDVEKGIDLLVCRERGMRPDEDTGILRNLDRVLPQDKAYVDRVEAYRSAVLAGHPTPLRHWKRAVGGAVATSGKDENGRAAVDYARGTKRAAVTLSNAFLAWSEIQWTDVWPRGEALAEIAKMIEAAPDDVRSQMAEAALAWPAHERQRLARRLAAVAAEERKAGRGA